MRKDFEEWFQAVEFGDGEMPLPTPADGTRWDKYVERHALALGAWNAAIQFVEINKGVKKAWDRFEMTLSFPKLDCDTIVSPLGTEKVYVFRRKGLEDFCTCDEERFIELSNNPLFETKTLYSVANS